MSTRDITIDRNIDDVWKYISSPRQFAQIFEGVSIVPIAEDAQVETQVDIRQMEGEREVTSSVIRAYEDEENKEIGYKVGSSLYEFSLEPKGARVTSLRVKLWLDPSPPQYVLEAYTESIMEKIKSKVEAFTS